MQTITRLRPRNLLDMAHEVAAVRPGVRGQWRRSGVPAAARQKEAGDYDIRWKKRALERTLGIILFQDQVNQLAIDVAGFNPSQADQLRRAFGRRHNDELLKQFHQQFMDGAAAGGVDDIAGGKYLQ